MTDDWLRDALEDAVADVEPRDDALDSLRSRTKVTTMNSKRPWLYGAAGAVLATAATITAFAVVGGGNGTNGQDDPGVARPPSATGEPTPTDDPTDAPPTPSAGGQTVSVPVYYLGEVSYHQGEGGDMQTALRLYREWHDVDAGGDSPEQLAAAALNAMFGTAPSDPDYRSPWSRNVVATEVRHEDGGITVDLSGPVQDATVGAESAEMAVQQLVYTVQGALAAADDEAATDPVTLLVDGEPTGDLWGHVDASRPIARAERTGTQAPIWVTAPIEGATVSTPFTVTGVAQVFEANVTWRLLRGGKVVREDFSTATEGAPAFGEFSFDVDGLDPGDYVLEVFEASALDGSPTFMDTKTFTVG